MSERDKNHITEMVETAKYLADHDPQGLIIVKNGMDMLRARCDLEKTRKSAGDENRSESGDNDCPAT